MSTELILAVENNPQDVKAFEALMKAAVAANDRETLSEVYANVPRWAPDNAQNHMVRILSQHARTATDPDLQSWLNYQNGVLFWRSYADAQMAEMAFRKVAQVPSEPGAGELLQDFYIEFYTAQNNWRRLEQMMTDPDKGGSSDVIEVRRRLAQLAEKADQADKAIGFWAQVRQDAPTDAEAEAALRRLYTSAERWSALVDLLRDAHDRLGTGDDTKEERIALLLETIDIYKLRMSAPAKVVQGWQQILALEPGYQPALDALAAEFIEMNRWPDLVKILQQKIEFETSTPAIVALHRQIADIQLERFANAGEAIKSHEAILAIEPKNRESLTILKGIYEQRHDYDNLVALSERELDLIASEGERFEALVTLARLASEKLRKAQTPIALWQAVLDADSSNVEALAELERWFEREKSWPELAEILERRVALEPDVAEQVNLLDRLGVVVASRLEDGERAADVWRQILARDGGHRKAQAELRKKFLAERDWDGLEWFFRNFGDVQEWVRTLEQQVKVVEEPEDKIALLFKAAALWQDELGDTRRAVKNFEAVLKLEPSHADTARKLITIYRELESWKELPAVYDIVLEVSEDPAERKRLLLEKAEVAETRLGDADAAFYAYVQAVSEDPADASLHKKLRELAELSSNWESYVYVLQDAVEHIQAETAQVDALIEVGQVYRDRLGADETALSFFNRALGIDPYHRVALDAAERAWEATGAYDQLILCFVKRLATSTSLDERRVTLYRLADVWRHAVGANDEAEAVLVEMLEDFPDELRAHDDLIAIYLEEARFGDMLPVLTRKRDLLIRRGAKAATLADVEQLLGVLTFGTVPEDEEPVRQAVDHYEVALRYEAGHALSVTRLEELLSDEGERLRITELLAPVYERGGDVAKLAQMLEIQWTAAHDSGDVGAELTALTGLGALYRGPLADADLSWRTAGRLFSLRPEDGAVRAEFEQLTEQLDRWEGLVALYAAHCDEPGDRASRVAVKLVVARTCHHRLAARAQAPAEVGAYYEQAKGFYARVRDEEPDHREAIDALEEIYLDLDQSEALHEIYRAQVELAPSADAKLGYLFLAADLLRDRLDQPDDAISTVREALALAPGHPDAVARLDGLFAATDSWDDLAATLESTIALPSLPVERVIALKNRLAAVYDQHLERPETAVEIYASVLTLDPINPEAVAALERLFDNPDLAPSVAPILQPYYEAQGDWQRLIAVYAVREEAAFDLEAKVDWNYRIAALYEHDGSDPERAFQHYMSALNLAPASEKTLGELLRLSDVLDNHGELILFLQSIVEDIPSMERRIETHRTIAALARDKSGDVAGADKHFRALLEIAPTDMPATDALIALYRKSGDTAHLVELLLQKAQMAAVGDEERFALYAEAGSLAAEALNDSERAIEIFEQLQMLDPNGTTALGHLEGLYERVSDWDNLVRVYRDKVRRSEAVDQKKYYASLTAFVQSDKMESPDDAITTWNEILGWDAQDADALAQLDLLYTQQADWYHLKEILTQIQGLYEVGSPEWSAAQFRIAGLLENPDQLGNLPAAIDAYGALLAADPTHGGAIDALRAILAERDGYQQAIATLRPVLEGAGRYEELWTELEVLVGRQVDEPERRVETLHDMALLAEAELASPERALGAQARAFALAPRNATTVAELERLAAEHEAWEELVAIYSGAVEGADDLLALELRLKVGAILADKLHDAPRAIATFSSLYEDFPDHVGVQERLHALYEAHAMWPELVTILRAQTEGAHDLSARATFLEQRARVAEEHLGDSDQAFEAYSELLDLDRTSERAATELRRLFEADVHALEASERLEPIYREAGRWDELDSMLQLKLALLEEPADQLQLMRDIALLALDKRGNEGDALRWTGEALVLDPEDDGLLLELERLAELTGSWKEANGHLLGAAKAATDDERIAELLRRAGVAARDRLGDAGEAERIFRMVLDHAPTDATTLRALDALLVAGGRWPELEPVLVAETKSDDIFDDERLVVWTRLAALYRDHLDDRPKAVAAWQAVLELQDMHEPALTALRAMYIEDEAWPELFEILQRLSDVSRDPDERVAYLADMAAIAEVRLGQDETAIGLWEDVLAAAPQHVDAVRNLQRLLWAQGERADSAEARSQALGGLAEAYERELRMEGALDSARKLDIFRELGRIWQGPLDDPFNAQSAWERARGEAPYDREALDALRTLHLASGNDPARGEILEAALVSEAYDPAEELDLWRELAELRTEVFGDQAGGIEAWRAVLQLAPSDERAISELEVLYENSQRWQDLVELYRRKLGLIEDDAQHQETWLQIGTIQQDNLQDVAAATATYQQILAAYPANAEASRRLEQIFDAGEQWDELAEVLTARSQHLSLEDAYLNYQQVARVHEQRRGDLQGAFGAWVEANALMPEEPQPIVELERLAPETGLWRELQATYEATLEFVEGEQRLELMRKSADVVRDHLGAPADAIALYERLLGEDIENEAALRALAGLNADAERWPELVDTLTMLSEVTPNYDEKKELLQQVGQVQEIHLGNVDAAIEAWNQALDLDERDEVALQELERLNIAKRDWHALIEVYEKDARISPEREVPRRLQIAGIYEQYTRETDEAVKAYDEVLGLDPNNEVAFDKLERIYSEREDYGHLLELYERAYEVARTDEERLRMVKNAAILHGDFRQDTAAATDAWDRVLDIAPADEEAFAALSKIHTDAKAWEALIGLYEKRYETGEDASGRADALAMMGDLYRDKLNDADNAIGMYERVLMERRGDAHALDALDGLLTEQGSWELVLENLEKKLEFETDPAQRVALLCRQGQIARDELDDHYRAATSFTRALAEQPGEPAAVDALLGIYRTDERWDKVVETLEHKLAHAGTAVARAQVHVDLAEVLAGKLNDSDRAISHFEQAEQADPESQRALEALADHYMHIQGWARAMTRLEALVDKLDPVADKALLAQTSKKLGLCAESLYLDDQALDYLKRSAELVRPDKATLAALGRLSHKKARYHDAEMYLSELLHTYRDELAPDEQVNVLMELGESALKTKNIAKAQVYLKQVVDAKPNEPKALEHIIEVLSAHEEWNEVLRYQEQLLALRTDKHARYSLLLAMGDVQLDHLNDRARATDSYRAALALDVFPKQPALKLLELSLKGGDYAEAIHHLNRLITLEDDRTRKAQFCSMAAVIYRDNLKEPLEAVKYINHALDNNLDNLQGFRTIDELLTAERDWKLLEQNYRRMIQRLRDPAATLANKDDILFKLYQGLGEIYRSRLMQTDKAIWAFEAARNMRPEASQIREILASLYGVGGVEDALDKAIAEHRWLIAQQPNRYDSYHALVEFFKKSKQYDASWCVAGLLTALRQATEAEARFYQSYLPGTMANPNRVVDQTLWMQGIMSRQEDLAAGRVLEIVYAGLGKARVAHSDKDYQLKRKARLDLNEGLLVTTTLSKVLRMFGMAAPEVYTSESASGIEFLQTDPPKLRLGTDIMSGLTDKELAFQLARRLTYFMPLHVVALMYPREALESLYLGAASVVDPNFQISMREDADAASTEALRLAAGETRAALERSLTPELRQQLTAAMRALWARTPVPELGRWHRAIELTAIHAGVVASNDPALALELLQRETTGMSKLSKQEKLKDNVLYVLSDAYLQLRKHLGMQIDYSDLM